MAAARLGDEIGANAGFRRILLLDDPMPPSE